MSIPKSTFLQPEKQQNVRSLLRDYYTSLTKHLVRENKEMVDYDRQNRRILHSKGELSHERKEKLESMQGSFDKLLAAVQSFADVLDENVPVLQTDSVFKEEEVNAFFFFLFFLFPRIFFKAMIVTGTGLDADDNSASIANLENIWGDIETQKFYCELPELQVFLPTSFLQKEKDKEKSETPPLTDAVTEETLDQDLPAEVLEDDGKVLPSHFFVVLCMQH